ncbi:hypothetical protein SDC9_111608 [bioreactor metagenome]|uniref:Zinc-ribbon domain-containing protein n=1 Tax=bioreactor metagenome TaxID=1076179 RepID=A0A645BGY4_9ZZZZ|nr:Zn-ribbon containing protein [Candidatus Metalachnospira sp.]
MKFCPNCGTKIEDQEAGCPNCGFKSFEYILEAKKRDTNTEINADTNADTNADEIKAEPVKAEPVIDEYQKDEETEKVVPAVKGKNEKYDYYENRSYDTNNYDSYDYINAEESVDTEEEPSLASKILLIVMVVLLNVLGAIIGFVVGGVFAYKNGRGYKSYGKKLVITSAVFLILDIFCWWMIFIALRNIL